MAALLGEIQRRSSRRQFYSYFPDEGEYRRELYPRHVEFFKLGARFNERAFVAGNRSGKTIAGTYELTCHLTGIYPDWWEGKRFKKGINAWCAGDTGKTTRDIIQAKMIGPPGDPARFGTAMIPGDSIIRWMAKPGVPDAIESVTVAHISGMDSMLHFKSYDQRREAFQGTEQHVIWLDEECPEDIYTECLMRTATTDGVVYLTFTPLMGLTPLVLSFLPNLAPASEPSKPTGSKIALA